jgi:Ca2+-dependent lipid-binding protein
VQVVNNCLNPVWNQTFDFVVEDGLHDMLIIEVWDHDTFGKVKKKRLLYFSSLSFIGYMMV